jgi:pentatricopeptide repeat protein
VQSALRRGLTAYQEAQYDDAIPLLRTGVEAGTLRPRVYAALSLSLLRTDQPQEAERVVETGTGRLGATPILRLARAEVLVRQGRLSEALPIYEALEAKAASTAAGDKDLGLTPSTLRNRIGRIHQKIGAQAFKEGDTTRARRRLEAARERIPDSAALYSNLGVLHLRQDRVNQALAMANQGLDQSPSKPSVTDQLLRLKASALQKKGKSDAVVPVYEQLAERHPNDVRIQIDHAQSLIDAREHEKGLKRFRHLLDRFPDDRRVYEALIDIYGRYKNTDGALRVLRRMQRQFPDDPEILRRIAERLEDLHRLTDARAAYDSVLTRTGDTLSVAQALGRTFEAQDSLAAAAAQYRRVRRQQPSSGAPYRDLGRVLEQRDRWEEVLDVYRQWEQQTRSAASSMHLGRAFEHRDELDGALTGYQNALSRGSSHPLPHARLAALYRQQDRPDSAFNHAVKALRLGVSGDMPLQSSATDSSQVDSVTLTAQQRRRQRTAERWRTSTKAAFRLLTRRYPSQRVEPVLDDLLADHPNSGWLHLFVGRYYDTEGAAETARRHLRRATELMPHSSSPHLTMGRVAAAQGDTTTALRAYERALSVEPDTPSAYSALIRLYRARGRLDDLIRRWQRRYETRPSDQLHEALLEALHRAGRYDEARVLAASDSSSSS